MQLPDFLHHDADGVIRIRGHRIRLVDVVPLFDEGHSPEGIVVDYFPTLELPLVYKLVAFFLENEPAVRELMRRHAKELEKLAAQPRRPTPTLDELRRRMESRRRAQAS